MCGDAGGDSGPGDGGGGGYAEVLRKRAEHLATLTPEEQKVFIAQEEKSELKCIAFLSMGVAAITLIGYLGTQRNLEVQQSSPAIEYSINSPIVSLGDCVEDAYKDNVLKNNNKSEPLLVSRECSTMMLGAIIPTGGVRSTAEDMQAKIQAIRDRAAGLSEYNKIKFKV